MGHFEDWSSIANSTMRQALEERVRSLERTLSSICIEPNSGQVFAWHDPTTVQEGSLAGNYVCARCGKES